MPLDLDLSAAHKRCLRDQVISDDRPGTLLRDFDMLIDFLRARGGLEAGGKYHLLPIKCLEELDQGLSRPLELKLKRPLLRSHPYLQGLNLLLRASGLGRVEGAGSKARLALDPALLVQWDQLNATERFFNLLEAWLRFGRGEMIGEPNQRGELRDLIETLHMIPERGIYVDPAEDKSPFTFWINGGYYQLALMDLFGILEVEHAERVPATWHPAGVKRTPFGVALGTALWHAQLHGELEKPEAGDAVEDEDDNEASDDVWVPRFGGWQPLFQPYFPEWRENLVLEAPEPAEGIFVFRASLGEVQRVIAMPSDATLHDLATWVRRSVNFDDDHLYQFTLRDRFGAESRVDDARLDSARLPADLVPIGRLPLEPGQTMDMLYDFGDCWNFKLKLERIEPPGSKIKAPKILEKRGRSPEQYPSWDD